MSDPNDPNRPDDPERPDPFPAFGATPQFSPFPPLEPEPTATDAPTADPAVVVPMAAVRGPEPDPPSDWNQQADAHDLIERENRLKAMARFAFPPGPPPDEEGLAARDRRWATRVILVVTLFMAVFNAQSPLNWSRQQPPGWVTETVEGLSAVWSAQVAKLGADMPRQGVREAYETARDSEWIAPEEEVAGG